MRTSEERIRELHCRMDVMQEKEIHRRYVARCTAAAAACLAVAVLLAAVISQAMARVSEYPGGAPAFSGSIFADHEALGYVVTAFLAFCLGTLVTILCFRLKRREKTEGQQDDRKH